MADQDELRYQGSLARYNAVLHDLKDTDMVAGQIGVFVLKSIITVNGAALIAVLTAYPHLRGLAIFQKVIPIAGQNFVLGLTFGLLAAFATYFYQSCLTASKHNKVHEDYGDKSKPLPFPSAETFVSVFVGPMIISSVASFVLFVMGCWGLLGAFAS